MNQTLQYIKDRIKEPSTWVGLTALLSLFGVEVSPEMQETLIKAGVFVVGFLMIFWKKDTQSKT